MNEREYLMPLPFRTTVLQKIHLTSIYQGPQTLLWDMCSSVHWSSLVMVASEVGSTKAACPVRGSSLTSHRPYRTACRPQQKQEAGGQAAKQEQSRFRVFEARSQGAV
ncbi:hypothetical protein M407DRAFT_151848 [Tulasnella calospora MUT 4182]|uniref:Uncharacterized protein n=1 Tax=Tulasnella calospora MUT 4182 TaxID=1051891 RepID=A0A0C3M9V9_9AGAM|nr:hypothetical protein M407DRAFT_151848 [Tulasnella calospora MUT 4182]